MSFGCAQAQPPAPQPGNTAPQPGSDRDSHGCIASAGYAWCDAKQTCIRSWEENCTATVAAKSGVRLITESFPPFNFAGKDGAAKGRSRRAVYGTSAPTNWHFAIAEYLE
ncbi:MAG: hypothetical protein NTX79_02085 [Candidatus Micrarchaeota archaeon]|nr:hypothetical protein [Candidatus Micrarchaeota archaeon]